MTEVSVISQLGLPVTEWFHLVHSEQKSGQDGIFQTNGDVLVHLGQFPSVVVHGWKSFFEQNKAHAQDISRGPGCYIAQTLAKHGSVQFCELGE